MNKYYNEQRKLPGSMHRNNCYNRMCKNLSIIRANMFHVLTESFLLISLIKLWKNDNRFLKSGEYFKHKKVRTTFLK